MKYKLIIGLVFLFSHSLAGYALAAKNPIPGDIRIVIGSSSTGGDTYQSSEIIAKALADKLGVKVTVDAVGVTKAFEIMGDTGEDGKTLMIFHDYAYLGYLYGVKGFKDLFAHYRIGPLLAINPGNAYLVPKSTPYWSIHDVIDACGQGTKVRVAIQEGGVSEIGYTALKHAIKAKYPGKEGNLVKVKSGSQKEKNKALFDGEADLINGSVQSNEKYTQLPVYDQKGMRFVWLTARLTTLEQANPEGFGKTSREALLKNSEPYTWVPYDISSNFTFDKEFFFIYNKKIRPEIVTFLDQTLADIYAAGAVQDVQKKSFFIPDFMPAAEAATYLQKKRTYIKGIIDGMK